MTEKTNKLFEALSNFQADNVKATRSSKNSFLKNSYANLDEVIQAVNTGSQYGLAFSQSIEFEAQVTDQGVTTIPYLRTNVYHKDSEQCLTSRCIIPVKGGKYENPHEFFGGVTYAKRYALCAIYGLATEDDDGNSATMGTDVTGKIKQNLSARTYTDPDTGEVEDVSDSYPEISAEDTKKINDFIKALNKLNSRSTYEEITNITHDKELKRLGNLILENQMETTGQYEVFTTLSREWGDVAKKLQQKNEYRDAKFGS